MNISFSKIKDQLKNVSLVSKINSHKHWQILLQLSLIVSVFLIIFGFCLLFKIKNEKIFQVDSTPKESPGLLKEELLKELTKAFTQKKLKENEVKNYPPSYQDPSAS